MSSTSREGLEAVCGTLLGLSSIAIGLRLYARKTQEMPLKSDDAFAILAWLMFIAAVATTYMTIHIHMLGYAFASLKPADLKSHLKEMRVLGLAFNVAAALTSAFIKLSALFFYRRLFCIHGIRKPIDYLIVGTSAVVALWALAYVMMPFFQCGVRPDAQWNGTSAKYCGNQYPYFKSLVLTNLLLDVWILLLPVPNIMRLHASIARKLSIVGVFLLAFVGIGASIARAVTYFQIVDGGVVWVQHHDIGLMSTRAVYLTVLEAGMCLIAVNLPSLWLLCTSVVPETALRSLRSVLSLSSLRSQRSTHSNRNATFTKDGQVMSHHSGSMSALHRNASSSASDDLEAKKSEVHSVEDRSCHSTRG